MSAQDWVMIIGSVFAGLMLILNTYLTWLSKQAVDQTHEIVNSQRTTMVEKIGTLEEFVRTLVREREDIARGKTLIQTAAGAAKDVLHTAEETAKTLKESGVRFPQPEGRDPPSRPKGGPPPP